MRPPMNTRAAAFAAALIGSTAIAPPALADTAAGGASAGFTPVPGCVARLHTLRPDLSFADDAYLATKPATFPFSYAWRGDVPDPSAAHLVGWRLHCLLRAEQAGPLLIRAQIAFGDRLRGQMLRCTLRSRVGDQAALRGEANANDARSGTPPTVAVMQHGLDVPSPGYYPFTADAACAPNEKVNNSLAFLRALRDGEVSITIDTRPGTDSGRWSTAGIVQNPDINRKAVPAPKAPSPDMKPGWAVASWAVPSPFEQPDPATEPLATTVSPPASPEVAVGAGKLPSARALGFHSVARTKIVVPQGAEGVGLLGFYLSLPKGAEETAVCLHEARLDGQTVVSIGIPGKEAFGLNSSYNAHSQFAAPWLTAGEHTLQVATTCGADEPSWRYRPPVLNVVFRPAPSAYVTAPDGWFWTNENPSKFTPVAPKK